MTINSIAPFILTSKLKHLLVKSPNKRKFVVNVSAMEGQFSRVTKVMVLWVAIIADYGRPMKPFFIEIQNFWAWADKFWGIWGIFGQTIYTHFGTVSSLSMFPIIQSLFLQKTSLYIHIPIIYLGFEFGLQRIRDLAFVYP
jgi:hypothetical protein